MYHIILDILTHLSKIKKEYKWDIRQTYFIIVKIRKDEQIETIHTNRFKKYPVQNVTCQRSEINMEKTCFKSV